ncbi:MAG: flagellar protein FlaG, partial [Dehalobacter sp.]|nr:flagellar protein FlaG [Dehalobacter sp.]
MSVDRSIMPIQQDVQVRPLSEEREAVSDKKANMLIKAQQLTNDDSEQKLEEAVEQINNTIAAYKTELKFAIHKESGMVSVKVIDKRDN